MSTRDQNPVLPIGETLKESVDDPPKSCEIGTLVLCRTDYVHPVGADVDFAKLRPIYVALDGRWERVTDGNTLFPDEGLIFWWNPPSHIKDKSLLWSASISAQPKYDGRRNRERLQVKEKSWSVTDEWFDSGAALSEDQLRVLFEEGIKDERPQLGKLLFRLEGKRFAGPIELSHASGTWSCPDNDVRSRVPIRPLNEALICPIEHNGKKMAVLAPGGKLPVHSAFLNLQSPLDALRGLMKRVRKLDQRAYEALKVTYTTYDAYIDALEKAGLPADQELIERARSARLKKVIDALRSDATVLEEVIDALKEQPKVQKGIEEASRREVQKRVDDQAALIAEDKRARQAELNEVIKSVEEAKVQLKGKKDQLQAAESEARELQGRLEEEFSRKLKAMISNPVSALAEHAIFKALLTNREAAPSNTATSDTKRRGRSASSQSSECVAIPDFEAVRSRLSQRLQGTGVSTMAGPAALGVCLSGSVPLIFGPHVEELLTSLAMVVAGGRLFRVPISAATYQVQDLFTRLDPSTGRTFEVPGSLSSLLAGTQGKVGPTIIVLEGINRAPLEVFLPPLLASFASSGQGTIQAKIPIGIPSPEDSGWFAWPEDALLIGTIVEGPSAFPIPRAMFERVALIPTWLGPSVTSTSQGNNDPKPSQLDPALLRSTRQAAFQGNCAKETSTSINAVTRPKTVSYQGALRLASGLEAAFGAPGKLPVSAALAIRWLPMAALAEAKEMNSKAASEHPEEWIRAAASVSARFVWNGTVGLGDQ
jgi:hypothetical protein